MSPAFSRRDFLKLAGMLPASLAAPRWTRLPAAGGQQNVLVIVFDAWTALNVSLYGYPRQTMPNLERLAQRAIVYHDHYAGGNFTSPGTGSLLTGSYPWSHRAILKHGEVRDAFVHRSLFSVLHDYYGIGYTHNPLAYTLLEQFRGDMQELPAYQSLMLTSSNNVISRLFANDDDVADVGWVREATQLDGYSYSLFYSHIERMLQARQKAGLSRQFPRGLAPWVVGQFFLLETALRWAAERLVAIPQPFVGYFHFLPPHGDYRPPFEFSRRFRDDHYELPKKPTDEFAVRLQPTTERLRRLQYDQYLLYVDQQFAWLYQQLESAGILDNSWLVLTADHGEMFERGVDGHSTESFYQPIVHIPLLVFEPGRRERLDVHTRTSAVDVLPTLAQISGHAPPAWTEGTVLPPFAAAEPDPNRIVYGVRATGNDPKAPLTNASIMQIKGRYKLVYYFGFTSRGLPDQIKLFDLEADPEELNDLAGVQKDVAAELWGELKAKIAEVNKPYE